MGTVTARMDLESITRDFVEKHLDVVTIHAEINNVLGEATVGYSTVIWYL
jgi:hypothetical protein